MYRPLTKSTLAALAVLFASPLYGQGLPGSSMPSPANVQGTANANFRQHDLDVVEAKNRVRDGEILTGDRYALRPTLEYISGMTESFVPPDKLLDLRRKRHDHLATSYRRELDQDRDGQPIARNRVLLLDPSAANLAAALAMGFRVEDDRTESALGLRLVVLETPRGQKVVDAVAALNAAAPGIGAEVDPIYEPAGAGLGVQPASTSGAQAAGATGSGGVSIVMIDGGVANHSALKGALIEKQGFAGKAVPTAHGTAIASLLVGNQGPFRGAAFGAKLYAADIYGGNPAKGSASTMFRALGWAASKKPTIVAISLVGPRSTAIERAIAALQKGGAKVVAAVGNDGSKAPNAYPASYSGVVAVTGTDRNAAPLMEAGRAEHIDFAAPGVGLVAAASDRGFMAVRGTSFAVPLVVGRIAHTGSIVRLAREAQPGRGDVGLGVLCGKCGLAPETLGKAR